MKQLLLKKIQFSAVRFKKFSRKSYSSFNSIHKVVSIGVLSSYTLLCANVKAEGLIQKEHMYPNKYEYLDIDDTNVNNDTLVNNNLQEVVVTSLKQTAKQVFVITSDEIKALPIQSVQDLLNYVTGIDVQQRGGHGIQADISVRGGSFDQTAILLNGINLSNPQTGHFSLDIPVNVSDIKQIEIIYGPSSFTYGASAFAGGINIITNTDPTHTVFVKVEGGTHNLLNIEANTGLKIQNNQNQLSVGHSKSDGYMNNSDYKISNILWQSVLKLDQSKINLQLGYNEKQYGANTFYSAAYPNQYDKTKSSFVSVKSEFGNTFKIIPAVYWSRHNDEFQLFRNGTLDIPTWYTGHNYHRTDVLGLNLNFQYKTKYGITNLAAEIRNEHILSNVLGKERKKTKGKYTKSDDRTNMSYTIEQTIFLDKTTTLSGGLLLNYNSALSKHYKLYPNVNISHWLSDNIKSYGSWSKAFRMPTYTDLYYTTVTHIGNSNLKEENSQSVEFGMQYKNSLIETSIVGYWMQGKNLIDWVKQNTDDKWESQNLTKIDKLGVDIGVSLFINKLFPQLNSTVLQLNYTRLHQNKDSDGLISNYVLNYLRDKLNFGLKYSFTENFSVSYNLRWQKRMGTYLKYVDLKPTTETPYAPFCISDFKFNFQSKNWGANLNLNNIFNKKYYDIGNVPQAGFWLISGITYTL